MLQVARRRDGRDRAGERRQPVLFTERNSDEIADEITHPRFGFGADRVQRFD
jgi:hypothetical protein